MTAQQCPLAYPDKFHAAAKFWKLQPPGTKTLSQENQLLLYALNQQATVGPNTTTRPWGWNVVETTKWQGWKELGKMTTMEAMRLFVRTLDDEQPDWWALLRQSEAKTEAEGPEDAASSSPQPAADEAAAPAPARTVAQRALLGLWTQLEAAAAEGGGKKPLPRYESAAAVLDGTMYVLGGNYGGRYLSDVWALDLTTGAWSPVQLQHAAADGAAATDSPVAGSAFPPTAGHSATAWQGKLYVLGGHTKVKGDAAMALRVVDPVARTVSEPQVAGAAPSARGGHTATLVGGKVWVVGGEDSGRRALADVHVLDLDTLTWSSPEVGGKAPLGRSASCATALQDRYIVMFGGGSVATCFSDMFLLDTQQLSWTQLAQTGAKVTPRAGHSGAVLGGIWYIVGGGNNVKGCTDLLAADLSGLPDSGSVTWHVVTSVALRDPLSSEGISLVVIPGERVLVAFGGYNGKYQNAVSLFRAPEGSAALLAGTLAAAAVAVEEAKAKLTNGSAAAAAAESHAPAVEPQADAPSPAGKKAAEPAAAAPAKAAAPPPLPVDPAAELRQQVSELKAQLEGARHEAETAIRESAAAKESAAHELALLRKQLSAAQTSSAEANKALEDSRSALGAEQSKVLKLEAQMAELQAKLGQLGELERELDKYRRAAREAAEKEAAAKKGGGGFWGYIAGSGSSSS